MKFSYYAKTGLPSPSKPSAKPRTVLTVERGDVFGRLTVLLETVRPRGPAAVCRCACGNIHTVAIYHLRAGTVQSCGCLRRQSASASATKNNRARADKQMADWRAGRAVKVTTSCAPLSWTTARDAGDCC